MSERSIIITAPVIGLAPGRVHTIDAERAGRLVGLGVARYATGVPDARRTTALTPSPARQIDRQPKEEAAADTLAPLRYAWIAEDHRALGDALVTLRDEHALWVGTTPRTTEARMALAERLLNEQGGGHGA